MLISNKRSKPKQASTVFIPSSSSFHPYHIPQSNTSLSSNFGAHPFFNHHNQINHKSQLFIPTYSIPDSYPSDAINMAYDGKAKTFEGRLNKRGKINKAWKERWFVLEEYEQKIEYYPTKQDAVTHQNLCGTIDISLVQRIEIISNIDQIALDETELLNKNKTILSKFIVQNEKARSNQPYSFQLVMSSRTYIFSALDSKSYIAWLNELCRVIYGGIVHEGILSKLGYRNKSWKSRYFTLNKYKQMKYYVDKTRKEFLGLIDLNLCILIKKADKSYGTNYKYTIEIQTPNRNWIICPADKQQKYEWEKKIKGVRWEKFNEQQTDSLIQQNLWKNHAEDIKALQQNNPNQNGNNNLMLGAPTNIHRANTAQVGNKGGMHGMNAMSMSNPNLMSMPPGNGGMSMNGMNGMGMPQSMDDSMYNLQIQKQMMMQNWMLANQLQAMNQAMMPMYAQSLGVNEGNNTNPLDIMKQSGSNMNLGQFNNFQMYQSQPNSSMNNNQNNNNMNNNMNNMNNNQYGNNYNNNQVMVSDDDEKFKEFEGGNDNKKQQQQQEAVNKNDGGLKVEKVSDCWDASLVGKTNRVQLENGNLISKSTITNDKQWYNLFSSIITENQVQYHWKIKIKHYNKDWVLIIGIMDTCYIDEYVQYNNNEYGENKNYFAKSKYGYGIDASGNLQNGGKNGGKYCNEFKNGDIVDVYFDMKQFVLWYGLNGKEYGVACKVHESFYKCCIAMFGPSHCIELVSCDTYFYPN